MPKTKTQPVPHPNENPQHHDNETTMQEPLSGSKQVKNQNHSRQKQHTNS